MRIPDDLSYDRAAARIARIMVAIAALGTVAALAARGWRWGAGFLLGSAISGLNYPLVEAAGGEPGRAGSRPGGFRGSLSAICCWAAGRMLYYGILPSVCRPY